MKLYSHPRSGTNYMLALLEQAFLGGLRTHRARTGHWSRRVTVRAPSRRLRGGHQFYTDRLPGLCVYLYRDGRDVALSLWRTKGFQHKSWRDLSFSAFLRKPLDWQATPGKRARAGWTIIEHWRRHLDSWREAPDTIFVRYEDVLQDPRRELERIAHYTGRNLSNVSQTLPGQGPYPSGDYRVAKWRDVFTDEDLGYFFNIIPKNHWGLYARKTAG